MDSTAKILETIKNLPNTPNINNNINNNGNNKYLLKPNTTDKQMVSIGIDKFDKTIDIPTVTNKKYDNDFLFEHLADLVSPQFRAWYCKVFYSLGRDEVLRIASIARADGENPRKLFSHLLKQQLVLQG